MGEDVISREITESSCFGKKGLEPVLSTGVGKIQGQTASRTETIAAVIGKTHRGGNTPMKQRQHTYEAEAEACLWVIES